MSVLSFIRKKNPPFYVWVSLFIVVVVNMLAYVGGRAIAAPWAIDMMTALDEKIPVINQTVYIYLVCYVFWAYNYIRICSENSEVCCRFVTSEIIAKIISGLFFVFMPTFRARPIIVGSGLSAELMRLVYNIDAANNLFPSVHCLVSYFCWRGLLWCPTVSKTYRRFSFVFAVLVFVSTVTTAQHVLIDIVGGILVAELGIWLASRKNLWQNIHRRFYTKKGAHVS